MSTKEWLVIGISGVTCGGKSSLARKLNEELRNSVLLAQDDYFLPANDPRHVKIPELNFNNWEVLTSLDMQRMRNDVQRILRSTPNDDAGARPVLIIEGFLIFKCKTIRDLCHLKYFLTLPRDVCWLRRNNRVYDPPDIPGYFDKVVWPEYVKHETELRNDKEICKTIVFIDGSRGKEEVFRTVSTEIKKHLLA